MGALLASASAAQAQRPPSLGAGAPSGQSGIQLYNFSSYYLQQRRAARSSARPRRPSPRRTASARPRRRRRRATGAACSRSCSRRGIKHVELYGYPGNPFPGTNPTTPLNLAGLKALRALGDQYGLRFTGRHGNLTEANWDNQIMASKILGQDHIGESGLPGRPAGFNTLRRPR